MNQLKQAIPKTSFWNSLFLYIYESGNEQTTNLKKPYVGSATLSKSTLL